ncbi:MAG: hypothetical protein HY863_02625 [Chloroflexi bacterium]|nr:hypothetical protein [Chloroflexota bacterium]
MPSKTPVFNLKAVLQETGPVPNTLRARKHRYDLPIPQRSTGGQYDIKMIKWLMARQAEGLSISRPVDLRNEITASGLDPLAGGAPSTFSSPQATLAIDSSKTNLDSLRVQWVAACLNFREASANKILNQAFSMYPVEAVCMNMMQKGLSRRFVGRFPRHSGNAPSSQSQTHPNQKPLTVI